MEELPHRSNWNRPPESPSRAATGRLPALVALALGGLLLAAAAGAAAWQTAPIWGGDVRSLAIHPSDPDLVLAGTAAGHLYLSRDGGASWAEPGGRRAFPGWVVETLAFDPNPGPGGAARLWAGLWGVWGGGMVARSDDLGESWTYLQDGLPGDQVYSLTPVPGRPGRLYIGTRTGVHRSDDGGATWRPLTASLPHVQKVTSLLVPPGEPETVYAGTWRRAYRSDDGGTTWRGVFEGMALDSEVFTLEPVPERPGEIWASTCGWVYRTLDGGGRWQRFREGLATRRTPSFQALPGGQLLAGTVGGLYVSGDGGESWELRTLEDLSVQAIAHHPNRPYRVLLGTEGSGVWISTDGATSFQRSARGMTNVRVTALARAGREILAAVNHAGPASGLYSSIDGGASFQHQLAAVPPILDLAVEGDRVFAATEGGLYERAPGSGWAALPELAGERVEGLAAGGGRVVARTAEGLLERRGLGFEALAGYRHGPPRSAVLAGDALWVADREGLYRLTGLENHTVPTPGAGARLAPLGRGVLLTGEGGAWLRAAPEAPWLELRSGATRALPTGDPGFPAVLVGETGAQLLNAATGELRPIPLDLPSRDLAAALVDGGRLYLGTTGYGLLVTELAPPPEPAQASSGR